MLFVVVFSTYCFCLLYVLRIVDSIGYYEFTNQKLKSQWQFIFNIKYIDVCYRTVNFRLAAACLYLKFPNNAQSKRAILL